MTFNTFDELINWVPDIERIELDIAEDTIEHDISGYVVHWGGALSRVYLDRGRWYLVG